MGKITEFVTRGKQSRDRSESAAADEREGAVPDALAPAGRALEEAGTAQGYTAADVRERYGEFPHAPEPPALPGPRLSLAAAIRDAIAVLQRPVPPAFAIRNAAAQRLLAALGPRDPSP